MPYLQGHFFIQKGDYQSIPFSMGIEPFKENMVLDLNSFLIGGSKKMKALMLKTSRLFPI